LKKFTAEKKPSALKREHPELQTIKFLNFSLIFVGNFALLEPDFDPPS
jgi:hypothetical protein